jgi:hypothetical protein
LGCGILSRITEPLKALPCTYECQLKDGSNGELLGLQGKPVAAGQPRFFEIQTGALGSHISGIRKLLDAEMSVA